MGCNHPETETIVCLCVYCTTNWCWGYQHKIQPCGFSPVIVGVYTNHALCVCWFFHTLHCAYIYNGGGRILFLKTTIATNVRKRQHRQKIISNADGLTKHIYIPIYERPVGYGKRVESCECYKRVANVAFVCTVITRSIYAALK